MALRSKWRITETATYLVTLDDNSHAGEDAIAHYVKHGGDLESVRQRWVEHVDTVGEQDNEEGV